VAAGGDRAGYDALTLLEALHCRTELFYHPDWFVADGQSSGNWILAFEDVDVGAADRCCSDSDECVEWPDIRDRLGFQHNAAGFYENGGLHM
jgi:hypothetical protein